MNNSLVRNSKEMDQIRRAVKEAGIFVVLGHSERDGGSLYIAQSFISPQGEIVLHRRKIKPTHVERAIWGDGQADCLQVVVDSPFGRVGGLNCWEHLQPLLRYNEYSQGVQIHVASWPPMFSLPEDNVTQWQFSATNEGSKLASQNLAMEGGAFVLVATQVLTEPNLKKLNLANSPMCQAVSDSLSVTERTLSNPVVQPGGGFSMIFGPDGRPLVKALPAGVEGILHVDVELRDIDYSKAMIDTVGHYSRPDLLSLCINPKIAKVVTRVDE